MNHRSQINQAAIARIVGGEGIEVSAQFGPMFASQVRLQAELHKARKLDFPHIDSNHDRIIVRAFERVRDGMSVDRFLCDPILSRRLQQECGELGLRAAEPAINLRLLAIRKSGGRGVFKETKRPTSANDVVERLGLGVEAAMRQIAIRYGASIDDMLAHPLIGEAFVKHARSISRGGNEIEYRLCALQIRKSRHISGIYEEKVAGLKLSMVERRWETIGSLKDAAWKRLPKVPGLVELREPAQSLFLLRTRRISQTVEDAFTADAINRLLKSDYFNETNSASTLLRYLPKPSMPAGTPKAWELFLIHEFRPRFNWPVTLKDAAA